MHIHWMLRVLQAEADRSEKIVIAAAVRADYSLDVIEQNVNAVAQTVHQQNQHQKHKSIPATDCLTDPQTVTKSPG